MFEKIDEYTSRMKVPDGWIVRTIVNTHYLGGAGVHQIFIHDGFHQWELEKEDD